MKALYSYSPLEDTWCLVTQFTHERASCGISPCNNKLFITGGRDEKNEVIATVLCWDPETQKLTEECVLPRGVSHHGSVTLRKSYTHIRRIVPGAVSVWLQERLRKETGEPQVKSKYLIFHTETMTSRQQLRDCLTCRWWWMEPLLPRSFQEIAVYVLNFLFSPVQYILKLSLSPPCPKRWDNLEFSPAYSICRHP